MSVENDKSPEVRLPSLPIANGAAPLQPATIFPFTSMNDKARFRGEPATWGEIRNAVALGDTPVVTVAVLLTVDVTVDVMVVVPVATVTSIVGALIMAILIPP